MDKLSDLNGQKSYKKYLVHVICQDVQVNDKPFKILFLKDVSFGVLYEQVKASEQLKNMINNLIGKKIGEPLEKLIHTCKLIE